jgi:hypothetical protein
MRKATLTILFAMATTLSARADIVSTTGLTQITAPPIVGMNFLINQGLPNQSIFAERQGVTLSAPLATDTGTINAGTIVDSWFFAVNFQGPAEIIASTSMTFSNDVLGVVFLENNSTGFPSPNFALSDFLGAPGTTYNESTCMFCAFENVGQTQPDRDFASISSNHRTVFFTNNYSQPGDFARIIVEPTAAVPGPIVGTGLPGLMAALGFFFWRRRQYNVA